MRWDEASCKGRLEANEFFRELVTWGHSLLVLTIIFIISALNMYILKHML